MTVIIMEDNLIFVDVLAEAQLAEDTIMHG